ncbi:universal stress protein [Kineococcus terrestris]|uniref:universal stress protein n=1 Tax=Kineococcus terrestris TaxID=2044856 RepID=UPI0034DB0C47
MSVQRPERRVARGAVVVGVGDLEGARAAVAWAARQAAWRGVELELVSAVPLPVTGDAASVHYAVKITEEAERAARAVLDELSERVRAEHPGLLVHRSVPRDHPRHALRRAAEGAALLVTGARRRSRLRSGALGGFQLGSTSLYAASHARCPVAVVREDAPAGARGVVVGHDGSRQADAAVDAAAALARAAGTAVRVLRVWAYHPAGSWLPPEDDRARARERVREEQRRSLEEVCARARAAHPGVEVTGELVEDVHPSDALLTAAAHAQLLVVGARGHGAFLTALLGSTSHDLLHRAGGPVVVVPDAARSREVAERGRDGTPVGVEG